MATLLLALGGLGEMAVGAHIVAFPREVALLIVDVALDAKGALIARMLGCAALALGLTWWMARKDTARMSHIAAGFIVYNAGVGAMFAMAALDASQPLIPWLVCVAHIGMAVAFAISLVRGQSAQTSAS